MVAIEAAKLSITTRKSAICSSVDLDFGGCGVVMVRGWDGRDSGGSGGGSGVSGGGGGGRLCYQDDMAGD
jgi:hypothetical protein